MSQHILQLTVTRENDKVKETNIGYNNFDHDGQERYRWKPWLGWPGLYTIFTFMHGDTVIASNHPSRSQVPIPDSFLKYVIKRSGLLELVEVEIQEYPNFSTMEVIRYKTWSKGKVSDWKSFKK